MISDAPKQPQRQAGLIQMKQNFSKRCNVTTNAPQILPLYVRFEQIRHCQVLTDGWGRDPQGGRSAVQCFPSGAPDGAESDVTWVRRRCCTCVGPLAEETRTLAYPVSMVPPRTISSILASSVFTIAASNLAPSRRLSLHQSLAFHLVVYENWKSPPKVPKKPRSDSNSIPMPKSRC